MAEQTTKTQTAPVTDAKWQQTVETLATIADGMKQILPSRPVLDHQAPLDRDELTTPEEIKVLDDMVGKDFVKLGSNGKPVDTTHLFSVKHIFPQFQSSNPAEFVATFFVEEYTLERQDDGLPKRRIISAFNAKARDFKNQYQVTVTQPGA